MLPDLAKFHTLNRLYHLRKWMYPPDKVDDAIELCLKQAEALSEHWTAGM